MSKDYCVKRLWETIDQEAKFIKLAQTEGKTAKEAYEELGDSLAAKRTLYSHGNFLLLANKNWDHFLPNSLSVYKAGHLEAMEQAIRAAGESDEGKRRAGLELAYAMNAFADHYVTDMFSAGHIRVPRKALSDRVTPSSLGAYLARYMHNEDGGNGVSVTNSRGDKWSVYGDGSLFDEEGAPNKNFAIEATQQSADEIWEAFSNRRAIADEDLKALRISPDPAAALDPNNRDNDSPLFTVIEGKLYVRDDLFDLCNYQWKRELTSRLAASLAPRLECKEKQTGLCRFVGLSTKDPECLVTSVEAEGEVCVENCGLDHFGLDKDYSPSKENF